MIRPRLAPRLVLSVGLSLIVGSFAAMNAEAKCSRRSADALIVTRYEKCNSRALLSYLYNNIITPYSFQCSKKIAETCKRENCDTPSTPEEKIRCDAEYAAVLKGCEKEVDDAARMASCKDLKTWPALAAVGRLPQPGSLGPTTQAEIPSLAQVAAVHPAPSPSATTLPTPVRTPLAPTVETASVGETRPLPQAAASPLAPSLGSPTSITPSKPSLVAPLSAPSPTPLSPSAPPPIALPVVPDTPRAPPAHVPEVEAEVMTSRNRRLYRPMVIRSSQSKVDRRR